MYKIGTEWKRRITKCPICKKSKGYEELDSMGTSRCANCGSRFVPTMGGVMYVGDWDSYACNYMYAPPPNPIKYTGDHSLIPE